MNLFFVTLTLLVFIYTSDGGRTSQILSEDNVHHPRHGLVGNSIVVPEYDCALRAFTIEMSAYIAPPPWKANWTTLSQSAFQMNECNSTLTSAYQSSSSAKPFKVAPDIERETCHHTVFVDDLRGNDLFDGIFERPMKTIQAALSFTRTQRAEYGGFHTLCISIRGGTYYLGTNATSSSSQIGAIALTTNDSNLVIENYQNERVVLSGGTLLQLQWSEHGKTAAGGTIMKAQIPASVNVDQFNELYIDGIRAIVAKYPNGDPSTQGLYAQKTQDFLLTHTVGCHRRSDRSSEIHVFKSLIAMVQCLQIINSV